MEPYDEPDIGPDDSIIRKINPDQHVVFDENLNCDRVSTKAFTPSSEPKGGMSVNFEKLITGAGFDAREYVTSPKYIGSVVFTARSARTVSLRIGYEPLDDDPYHGEVWGTIAPNRFSRGQKRRLMEASEWFVEIPSVLIIG